MPKIKVGTTVGGHDEKMATFNVSCVDDNNPTIPATPPAGLTIQLYRNGIAEDTPKDITRSNQNIQFHLISVPASGDTFRFMLNQTTLFDTLFLYNNDLTITVPQPPTPGPNGAYHFLFDFESNGMADYDVAYRPGSGWIVISKGGATLYPPPPVNPVGWNGGIGGYDLKSSVDRVFAFDYLSSGKLDHLVCYRPGHGTIWILKHEGGVFSPIFAVGENPMANGIQGFLLNNPGDQVFAYNSGNGKIGSLALHSPSLATTTVLS